ncbi:hypothetical protein H072_3807 [Dactylellina haptotyla CBS 200.50]|uniref:Zn(2)-C6 fungal-type domain-containing protein n=1 Tax=Dactylellina haptotyla (strain CBS 200.50) TaxID=1284197 RepID=S8AMD2_DACHA|nr:hypothetical protein H072_3807 [Dactylellina haptotyla CBS 200.50]
MPRAPVAGREIRRRSRNGCWNCKARKVKCGEEKPRCSNCTRLGEDCDYKIRLSWGGRPLKKKLLEQGAQLDDASQNIPGAGQFSLNTNYNQPQFPSPAQFELATHSSTRTSPTLSSCTSKSSGSRKSSSSQAGLATYQNVFSVCEASPPTSLVNSSIPAPLHLANSSSPPRNYQHLHPYLWTLNEVNERPPLTPSTASTADSDLSYMSEESMFSSSSGYDFYPMPSPTPSLTHLTIGSPTGTHSIPPSPHGSYTDIGAFRRQRSISVTSNHSSSPHNELTYSNGLATTVPSLSSSMPSTSAGLSSQLYYASPVTPPSDQSTIRGNPYISGDKSHHRRSVENFAQDYPGYASRFVQPGDSYGNQHNHNSPPFTVGIVDAEADAVEDLHSASLDSKGSDGYATIKGHHAYLQLPKELNPLPQSMSGNPQSQVYFQHFLSETAPLLVPHDCNGNPFKSVLPQMAMNHDGLLNLLLAYSASHQARQAKQPEPTELVSGFLDCAYRHLHQSLNDQEELKSNATLATAIMLCSYEIISPNVYAEGISWRIHLDAARKIILARGGAKEMRSRDPVSFFLSRWFAYLDVLGSFSSNNNKNNTTPLFSGKYWTVDEEEDDLMVDFSVDCFFGFTNRFIGLLTCVGELAHEADEEKRRFVQGIQDMGYSADGSEWIPEGQLYHDALRVREHLEESRRHAIGSCRHKQQTWSSTPQEAGFFASNEPLPEDDSSKEMLASNDAFHWAAQIHLFRRVLNYNRQHQCVQDAIQRIIEAVQQIPEQSNVENAVLFPLFTAGCESIQAADRKYILRRLKGIEKSGMNQFQRARLLMQRVWETGSSWEDLIDGEFIG